MGTAGQDVTSATPSSPYVVVAVGADVEAVRIQTEVAANGAVLQHVLPIVLAPAGQGPLQALRRVILAATKVGV